MKIFLCHSERLEQTPALVLALKIMAELIEKKLAPINLVALREDLPVLYAVDEFDNILGFIHYYGGGKESPYEVNILIGGVELSYRRQNIYKTLYTAFKLIMKNQGIKMIHSSTHVDNIPLKEFATKTSRQIVSITYKDVL